MWAGAQWRVRDSRETTVRTGSQSNRAAKRETLARRMATRWVLDDVPLTLSTRLHPFVHVINGNGPGVNRHGFSRAAYLRGPSAIVLTVYFHASLVLGDQNVLAKGRDLLVGPELAITIVSLGRIGQDFDEDRGVREASPRDLPLFRTTLVSTAPHTTLASA